MILIHSRFAGLLAACVAGILAAPSDTFAQAAHRSGAPAAGEASGAALQSIALRSTLSGVVRDVNGRPQIGALVELLNAQYGLVARTFTDDRGHYSLPRLGQGTYQVKATNSFFLPTILPDLHLLADSKVIVNLTLSTLYQAITWLPAEPRRPDSGPDDWNWTLRLSANRPLLRALDERTARLAAANGSADLSGPVLVQAESSAAASERSRTAAVRTGLTRFGEGGLTEQAQWSANDSGAQALLFGAETSTSAAGAEALRSTGAYRQQLSPDRSVYTVVTITDRPRIHASTGTDAAEGLATARVRSGTTVQVGDLLELSAGTELAYARLAGGAATTGSHPYAAISVHDGATILSYRLATARSMADGDRVEAEAAEDAPLLSEIHGALAMEQGLHQELRAVREFTHGESVWTGELSAFADTLEHPAVEGAVRTAVRGDEAAIDSNNVLFDPGTGTIAVSGPGYHGAGIMAMLRDQLSPGTWLSFRYALGKATALSGPEVGPQELADATPSLAARPASMLAFTAETHVPETGTVLRGSYRWQPASTLTQVAPFRGDVPDAYLGLRVQQPLHLKQAGAGRLQAVLDVRNLLAQGYRPFLSQDGTTVYFAQAQRCIAGGVSFSF